VRVDLQRGVYVDGTTEVVVNTKEELLLLMDRGSDRRHVSATGVLHRHLPQCTNCQTRVVRSKHATLRDTSSLPIGGTTSLVRPGKVTDTITAQSL
jgi:hypothetical protein